MVGHFGNALIGNATGSDNNTSEVLSISNCTIESSSIKVSNGLTAKDRSWSMGFGGLIGSTRLSTNISDCSVDVDIELKGNFKRKSSTSGDKSYRNAIGGILGGQIRSGVGYAPHGYVSIFKCIFTGSIDNSASSFVSGQVAGILGGVDTFENSVSTIQISKCYAYMNFYKGYGIGHHPICCGNLGEWKNSYYSTNFDFYLDVSGKEHIKPYYKVNMTNNYFTLKENNTLAAAKAKFITYGKFHTSSSNGTYTSYVYTDSTLYQQPTSGSVTCSVPKQVDRNGNTIRS